jgi:hypothetical protein
MFVCVESPLASLAFVRVIVEAASKAEKSAREMGSVLWNMFFVVP